MIASQGFVASITGGASVTFTWGLSVQAPRAATAAMMITRMGWSEAAFGVRT